MLCYNKITTRAQRIGLRFIAAANLLESGLSNWKISMVSGILRATNNGGAVGFCSIVCENIYTARWMGVMAQSWILLLVLHQSRTKIFLADLNRLIGNTNIICGNNNMVIMRLTGPLNGNLLNSNLFWFSDIFQVAISFKGWSRSAISPYNGPNNFKYRDFQTGLRVLHSGEFI